MCEPEGLLDASDESSIAGDLAWLYDEIAEFGDCCAFICDAFCSLAAEEEALEASTVEGLRCMCHWMKQRVAHVKGELKEIQQKAASSPNLV